MPLVTKFIRPIFSRFTVAAWLVVLAMIAGAAPAVAQPYVYAATGRGVFRGGIHFTTLPTRLVTIDPVAGQAIASLTLSGCAEATGVAVRTDGVRVFVSCSAGLAPGSVLVIDPVAKQIVATRTFASAAGGVAVTPAGDRLVVSLVGGTAEVLDAASLATIGTINVGAVPGTVSPVLVSNDGATAYIAQPLTTSGRLVVASLTGFTVVTTIDFAIDNISDIALTADGARLVVGHRSAKMSIVNTATNSVTATVALPGNSAAQGVAADAGTRGFATAPSGVQAVTLASGTIAAELPPAGAAALGMSAPRDRLYAARPSTSLLTSVNPTTGTVVSSSVVKGGIIDLAAPAASPAIAANACYLRDQLQAGGLRQSAASPVSGGLDRLADRRHRAAGSLYLDGAERRVMAHVRVHERHRHRQRRPDDRAQ